MSRLEMERSLLCEKGTSSSSQHILFDLYTSRISECCKYIHELRTPANAEDNVSDVTNKEVIVTAMPVYELA